MKDLKSYIISKEIVKISSNVNSIPYFSFGENLLHVINSNNGFAKFRIQFIVKDDINIDKNLLCKFHFYFGNKNNKTIYYERRLLFDKFIIKMLFKEIKNDFKIIVNKSFYRLIRFRIETINPPGIHLTDALTIKLIQNNLTPLHTSAITKNNKGTLFFGPPDCGKSLTAFLSLNQGYNLLSEDCAITNGKVVYSCPLTSTFKYSIDKNNMKKKIINKIPILCYYSNKSSIRYMEYLKKNIHFENRAYIKNIFILDNGTTSITKIDKKEALRRILILNRNAFSYYKNSFILSLAYFNKEIDINKLMKKKKPY